MDGTIQLPCSYDKARIERVETREQFEEVAFGIGHTLQGLDAAVITGALGAFWGVMYLTRGSALGPIISHSLFNSGELFRVLLR